VGEGLHYAHSGDMGDSTGKVVKALPHRDGGATWRWQGRWRDGVPSQRRCSGSGTPLWCGPVARREEGGELHAGPGRRKKSACAEAAVTGSREKRRCSGRFRLDFGELQPRDQTIGTREGWGSSLRHWRGRELELSHGEGIPNGGGSMTSLRQNRGEMEREVGI
jgi:hypothetical protein